MEFVSRGALIVKAKKPYEDWANSVDDSEPKFDLNRQSGLVYLIEDIADPRQVDSCIEKAFPAIFEHELSAWYADPSTWPEKRDYELFKRWFDVQYTSEVIDVCRGKLKKD